MELVKPLLVGEANPYQTDPRLAQRYALYPDPPRCAGWNLCHRVMGLDEDGYLRRFDRANLCDGKWAVREARRRADELSQEARTFVLCGVKVSAAFAWVLGRDDLAPFTWHEQADCRERRYVVLPHPSGLSRVWNEPGAFERARRVLREAGVL